MKKPSKALDKVLRILFSDEEIEDKPGLSNQEKELITSQTFFIDYVMEVSSSFDQYTNDEYIDRIEHLINNEDLRYIFPNIPKDTIISKLKEKLNNYDSISKAINAWYYEDNLLFLLIVGLEITYNEMFDYTSISIGTYDHALDDFLNDDCNTGENKEKLLESYYNNYGWLNEVHVYLIRTKSNFVYIEIASDYSYIKEPININDFGFLENMRFKEYDLEIEFESIESLISTFRNTYA